MTQVLIEDELPLGRLDDDAELIGPPADLAIVIISTNEAHWLEPCLSTIFAHAGPIKLDVVVIDNACTDSTRELVESRFPQARLVASENHGFAHANNRGAMTCRARYVLFLNPDTEIVEGTFAELVADADADPDVGLIGVRQLTGDGSVYPTIRYFPSFIRALSEALGSERWPVRWRWSGERELDRAMHDRDIECDWVVGSFMLARREALFGSGCMDERFFIYSEEPDLCLRMKRDGWTVRHTPAMTIIHHVGKAGVRPRNIAQYTYTRRQYAHKHFSAPYRAAYLAAVWLNHALRVVLMRDRDGAPRRTAQRLALSTLMGRTEPPFGAPPQTAVMPATAGPASPPA